jgi:hypothetical protein
MGWDNDPGVEVLIGKTLTKIERDNSELVFTCDDGKRYRMYHEQDCCEGVTLDDVTGDLDDLIGSPILRAEESLSNENPLGVTKEYQDSFTWTFYKFATIKGWVDLRWYGESNGYYSESVDFVEIKD